MSEHSPLPWRVDRSSISGFITAVYDARGFEVKLKGFPVTGTLQAAANSELVLRAVNERDDMIAALQGIDKALSLAWGDPSDSRTRERLGEDACDPWLKVREALAKASA